MAADPPRERPPVGGAFGLPGGTAGMPGGAPGGGAGWAPAGLFSGPPGGITGPPGGVPPQALAALTLPAPLPGAMQAGALAPPPPGAGERPGGAEPAVAALPGAAMPLVLPDLQGAARRALESVVERAEAAPAPAPPGPVPESPLSPHATVPVTLRTPHLATAPVPWSSLPPAPAAPGRPPAWGPAVPGLWRGPPAPSWDPAPRARVELDTGERDLAQRIGDGLYPLIRRMRGKPVGWIGIVALFGLTVPVVLLRQSFDVRLRLVLSALTFFLWLGIVQDLG